MVADEHRVKGRRKVAWSKEGALALLLIRSASCAVPSQKIATWSAGRASGLRKARGRLQKAPRFLRRLGAPLPHACEGREKREALAPRRIERGR